MYTPHTTLIVYTIYASRSALELLFFFFSSDLCISALIEGTTICTCIVTLLVELRGNDFGGVGVDVLMY
jgi:hypothetical protein